MESASPLETGILTGICRRTKAASAGARKPGSRFGDGWVRPNGIIRRRFMGWGHYLESPGYTLGDSLCPQD